MPTTNDVSPMEEWSFSPGLEEMCRDCRFRYPIVELDGEGHYDTSYECSSDDTSGCLKGWSDAE